MYDINDATDNVRIWRIGYNTGDIPVDQGAYPINTLFKTVFTDEKGKKTIEYRNTLGQLVLKKIQLADNPANAYDGWICTYSVFDDFGLLRYRLQPEAVKYLSANGWSFAGTNGQQVLNELCFRYEYDEKQRNILKKAPGAKELNMLYDQRDRLVFMQDGNQKAKTTPEWTVNLYDELDRPTLTTLYATTKTIATLKSDIAAAVAVSTVTTTNPSTAINNLVVSERKTGISTYQAQTSVEIISDFESAPTDDFTVEINASATEPAVSVATATYNNPISSTDLNNASVCTIVKYYFYDSYSYAKAKSFKTNFDNELAYTTGDPITPTARTTNMTTGTRVRVGHKHLSHYFIVLR